MKVKYTKAKAKKTIECYKDLTCWFDNSISGAAMWDMLRYCMRFGDAESRVIIAALVLAGAKFAE